jgi:hypothetical protein
VSRREREELERHVQRLERLSPARTARQLEAELRILAPVAYGNWADDTPELAARLRQVQRWRRGSSGTTRPAGRQELYHVWPAGEAQRHEIDPAFPLRRPRAPASHRLFLRNCSEETLHEVGVTLAGRAVGYEPALAPGGFTEVHWVRNEAIRAAALEAPAHERLRHPLRVDYAYARGTKRGRFEGVLLLDAMDGWTEFTAKDGEAKEIV